MSETESGEKSRSFSVRCPYCNEWEAILIHLNALDLCQCDSCGETFSARYALETAAGNYHAWRAVCHWIQVADDVLEVVTSSVVESD